MSWGRFSSKELARGALLSAFFKSPGWWNRDAIRTWAHERAITSENAMILVMALHTEGRLDTRLESGRLNWRAKK